MSAGGEEGGGRPTGRRGPRGDGRSDPGYGTVARLFHWATVAMVAVLLPVGVAMTSDLFRPWSDPLFIVHKGLGSVLLLLVVARLAWKLLARGPDRPLPEGASEVELRLASLTHGALYAVLLLQTGSGYVRTRAGGYPIELLDALGVPSFIPEMPTVADALVVVHHLNAFVLTALIAAHVAAAVQHALVAEDGALRRMWPPVAPSAPSTLEEEGP